MRRMCMTASALCAALMLLGLPLGLSATMTPAPIDQSVVTAVDLTGLPLDLLAEIDGYDIATMNDPLDFAADMPDAIEAAGITDGTMPAAKNTRMIEVEATKYETATMAATQTKSAALGRDYAEIAILPASKVEALSGNIYDYEMTGTGGVELDMAVAESNTYVQVKSSGTVIDYTLAAPVHIVLTDGEARATMHLSKVVTADRTGARGTPLPSAAATSHRALPAPATPTNAC